MCGRYSALTEDEIIQIRDIIKDVSLRIARDDFAGSLDMQRGMPYSHGARSLAEVRPTDQAPVIIGHGGSEVSLENLRWGFKKWDGKGVIINARAETIGVKKMFSQNVGRCVVPAGEYFEWKKAESGAENGHGNRRRVGGSVKHLIKDKDGNILFMAGLYRETSSLAEARKAPTTGEANNVPSDRNAACGREFVVITKDSCGDVAGIHDRMPVILRADQIEDWFSGKLTQDDIVRLDFNMEVMPCETISDPEDEDMQLTLFH